VHNPIIINEQPTARRICSGEPTFFAFKGSGTIASQKWQISTNGRDWSDVTAATPPPPVYGGTSTNTLTLSQTVDANNGAIYRSVINGMAPCPTPVISDTVRLTVDRISRVTEEPVNKTVCAGENTEFSIKATGTNTTYKWQVSSNNGQDWKDILAPGVNPTYSHWDKPTLLVSMVDPTNDNYQYWCIVSGNCGKDTSKIAVMRVASPPSAANPLTGPDAVCTGQTQVEYSVNSIPGATSYQWTLPANVTGSSTTNIIKLNFPEGSVTGNVTVKGVNQCGSSNESSKLVTIKSPSLPPVSITPSESYLCPGSGLNLQVVGGSLGAGASWKWYSGSCGGTPVGTGLSLNLGSQVSTTRYFVRAEGDCNTTLCIDTLIAVYPATSIKTQPESMTACYGDTKSFSVEAQGPAPLKYKWYKGTTAVTGLMDTGVLELKDITFSHQGQYRCVVTSLCDAAGIQSEAATLTVFAKPTLNLGADKHLCPGSSLTLNAGAGFESYLWNTGENTRTIVVTQQDMYSVTVSDLNGCTNWDEVFVIADPLLPQVNLGQDVKVCKGIPVVLDATDEYDTYLWSNGSAGQTINVTAGGKYWVRAGRYNTVCTTSDSVQVNIAMPFDKEQLCIVTVSKTGKNMLVWEKTPDPSIMNYNIWKGSSTAGTYNFLGSKPAGELSVFVDAASSPESHSDKYKISITDTCHNESPLSPFHKTIHLAVAPAVPSGFNLSWDHIEVEGLLKSEAFPTYYIYRGPSYDALTLITTLSSDLNQWKDNNPPVGPVVYQISAKKLDACFPTSGKKDGGEDYSQSFSNVFNVVGTGISSYSDGALKVEMYPNPFSSETRIVVAGGGEQQRIRVSDITGKIVMEDVFSNGEYLLRRGNLSQGIYFVRISGGGTWLGKVVVVD
jgi:hypothetical protein